MATLADIDQQDQRNPQNPINAPTAGTSAPGTAQGGQQGAGSAAPNQSPVSQNINPQSAAGYTDVSAYLNANPQGGQQIANQAAQNLGQTYSTTKGAIDTSAGAANAAIAGGYTPQNTDLINQVASNPVAAASNPANIGAFQGQLNDVYGGPTSWADMGTLQGQVGQAQQQGNLFTKPGGTNILAQTVENQLNPGQTSTGINQLDALLLSGTPGAMQTIQNAARPFSTLGDYLNTQNTGIAGNIGQAQTAAGQTAQAAQNALTTGQQTEAGTINQNLQDLQSQINNYNTTLGTNKTAAESSVNKLVDQFGNFLGGQQFATWTPTRTATQGVGNASTFLAQPGNPGLPGANINAIPGMNAATMANATTPQDLATINALQSLAGNQNWNPAPGVTQAQPLTIPTGNPYGQQTTDFANSLYNYLGNTSFGAPVNNPLGQGGFGWLPATSGMVGQQSTSSGLANPELQSLINNINALRGAGPQIANSSIRGI